ncbi:MAG: penicillin-binding protein 2 [Deltaproteobacteria bacterium]|nr:penicillin-binding protein 2 [Deltaproteobacteria bacterium]
MLGLDESEVEARIAKAKNLPSYQPVIIKSDISEAEVAAIRANKTPWYDETDAYDLRGVELQMRYARTYSDSKAYSHFLGYLREIDANRLKKYEDRGDDSYRMGDFIGIGGVEENWDKVLRGEDGFDQKVVNAIGREVIWPDMNLIHEAPANGSSLVLTIDAELQRKSAGLLEKKSGAIVAIDPNNGEILALYSSPSIDLNRLSSPESNSYWKEIASDTEHPLYNRTIQGTYPPGSTYKIVTALAGLSEKSIGAEDKSYCGGGLRFGKRFYQCWRDGGHGLIDIKTAITSSCDTFFYQLGLKLGVDKIAKYANLLGLGHVTGIDLPSEKSGIIPTSEWKEKTYGNKWQDGENLSIAVGQGYDTVSPLQNALMIATIANGGKKITPHIMSAAVDQNGNETYRWQEIKADQILEPESVKIVKEGLIGVVENPSGTAYRLKKLGLKIAGKTGTAQVISREAWKSGVEKLKDHAWFVGFAPYDNPKIAVAAIVEHGGFGASAAAPVVGEIIKTYLKK